MHQRQGVLFPLHVLAVSRIPRILSSELQDL